MHPQTLRMYEQRGLIKPKRSPKGTRLYSQEDVDRLRRIQEMTVELGHEPRRRRAGASSSRRSLRAMERKVAASSSAGRASCRRRSRGSRRSAAWSRPSWSSTSRASTALVPVRMRRAASGPGRPARSAASSRTAFGHRPLHTSAGDSRLRLSHFARRQSSLPWPPPPPGRCCRRRGRCCRHRGRCCPRRGRHRLRPRRVRRGRHRLRPRRVRRGRHRPRPGRVRRGRRRLDLRSASAAVVARLGVVARGRRPARPGESAPVGAVVACGSACGAPPGSLRGRRRCPASSPRPAWRCYVRSLRSSAPPRRPTAAVAATSSAARPMARPLIRWFLMSSFTSGGNGDDGHLGDRPAKPPPTPG